jgi:PleD family two-component response regulator
MNGVFVAAMHGTAQKLIEAADQSFYRAKHLGRNRTESVQVEAA